MDGDGQVDLLKLQYGAESGVVGEGSIEHEWNELRCYLSMHCRSLSMLQVIQIHAE